MNSLTYYMLEDVFDYFIHDGIGEKRYFSKDNLISEVISKLKENNNWFSASMFCVPSGKFITEKKADECIEYKVVENSVSVGYNEDSHSVIAYCKVMYRTYKEITLTSSIVVDGKTYYQSPTRQRANESEWKELSYNDGHWRSQDKPYTFQRHFYIRECKLFLQDVKNISVEV